jgi:[ribosomal protein S5]-alanine N-acetyltransferase
LRVIETERLLLCRLTAADAAFVMELVNEPAFIKNIGDKGVRNLQDAVGYITNGPIASYAQHGFGLYRVELKDSGVLVGMCGLLKRDTLEHPDIGFAFLKRHWGQGYAYESASAVMRYGREVLRLPRIVAITAPDNEGSRRVLEKIGLRFEKMINVPGYDTPSRFFTPVD